MLGGAEGGRMESPSAMGNHGCLCAQGSVWIDFLIFVLLEDRILDCHIVSPLFVTHVLYVL